jgi:hypothetical protein
MSWASGGKRSRGSSRRWAESHEDLSQTGVGHDRLGPKDPLGKQLAHDVDQVGRLEALWDEAPTAHVRGALVKLLRLDQPSEKGERDRSQLFVRLESCGYLAAVPMRSNYVEQYEIGSELVGNVQRPIAVRFGSHDKPTEDFEHAPERSPDHGIVVDQ